MAPYYLLPGSAYLSQYKGVEVRQAPKNVWLSITFSGSFDWLGVEVNSDRCSCLANIDDNGKWSVLAHIDSPMPVFKWAPLKVRLWRLAKESEVPTGQDG